MTCDEHTVVSHVAVLHDGNALLLKYAWGHDEEAGWFLPNDGLRNLEHPEEAARRILLEHAGLKPKSLNLVQIESFAGKNKTWHLIFDYLATVESTEITKGEDVTDAKWVTLEKLPPNEEFAHHGWGRALLLKAARQ